MLFPLKPLDNGLIHSILTDVCHAMSLSQFKEASCCIGSQLMPIAQLSSNCHMKRFMSMLKISGVIRTEILSSDQNILDIWDPVIDHSTSYICIKYRVSIRKSNTPQLALVQGLWLGEVPEVLTRLMFAGHILIAKVRHNCCFVKVSLTDIGFLKLSVRKIISYIISFNMIKVYNILLSSPEQI